MEASKEGIYLLLDIEVHLMEREQFDILSLVTIVDSDVRSALFECNLLIPAKVVASDGEVLAEIGDIVVEVPPQVAIAVIIHIRQVLKEQLLSNHHLVERSREEALKQLTIKDGLANHASNELKEVSVVRIDVGLRVSVVADSVRRQVEQRVIWIEHGPGQLCVELSRQAACIDASFALKVHLDLVLELGSRAIVKLLVGALEDIVTIDSNVQASATVSSRLPLFLDLLVEVFALGLEVEEVGHVLDNVAELEAELCATLLQKPVDGFLVV